MFWLLLTLVGCDLDNPFRTHEFLGQAGGVTPIEGSSFETDAVRWRRYLFGLATDNNGRSTVFTVYRSDPPSVLRPHGFGSVDYDLTGLLAHTDRTTLVALSDEPRLSVFDLTEPEEPVLMAEASDLGIPRAIAAVRLPDHVLLADVDGRLHLIDLDGLIAAPGEPSTWLRTNDDFDLVFGLDSQQDRFWVHGVTEGREVLQALIVGPLDLEASFRIVPADDVPDLGSIVGFQVSDEAAYVVAEGVVHAWDFRDPAAITHVDRTTATSGVPWHLDEGFLYSIGGENVDIVDVRKVDKPRWVHTFPGGGPVQDVATAGTTVYVVAGQGGIKVFAERRNWDAFFEDWEDE